MFRFTRKPSSGSHNQFLAKNTSLVQCRYRSRTDVSIMAAHYAAVTLITEVRCVSRARHTPNLILYLGPEAKTKT